jgi:carboxymethylenebutenolidase
MMAFCPPILPALPCQARLPVMLVVQEIFGVHEHIRDICRRLAKLGYLAIAPELYFRQGNPAEASDITTIISTIVSKVADQQVMQDLDATLAWAGLHGGDAAGRHHRLLLGRTHQLAVRQP